MGINRGVVAAVAVAGITGLGAAACASSQQAHAAAGATKTAATAVPAGLWATEIHPSEPATLPPSERGCGPKPLIKDVRVVSVAKRDGTYEINAYVESVTCGPGVPDDVEFTDTGAVQSFPAAATATYTLTGSDPTKDYAVSADTFMAVLDGKGNVGGELASWNRICVLHLDQSGRVVSAAGAYTP